MPFVEMAGARPARATGTDAATIPPAGPGVPPAFRGVLFLVVGPSGVGKDTLIDGARARLGHDPAFRFVRRVVTRPAGAVGEDHEAMDEAAFAHAEAAGRFAVTWRAHGLAYGIRRDAINALGEGRNVVVNASRRAVPQFVRLAGTAVVLSIVAPAEVVRSRLAARGREDADALAARLSRVADVPDRGRVVEILNDGTVEAGVKRFVDALLGAATLPLGLARAPLEMAEEPIAVIHEDALVMRGQLGGATRVEVWAPGGRSVRARLVAASSERVVGRGEIALSRRAFERIGAPEGTAVLVRRSARPPSRDILRRKVAGEELTPAEMGRVVRDIVEWRYEPAETAGFLVAAAGGLSVAEVAALTSARAELFERLDWGGRLVADKHSMGGVPGGPITLVVVPIVAAHGLLVPKTSSRAITSAAGTADVMECLARVDLSPAELRRAVEEAGGAVAWSGRISHGPLDDVMNAINRPLGIRSASLDVASILSKKLVVGATHVVVDVPFGPGTKTRTRGAGEALARLFETVGRSVGLHVEAVVTDGSRPVGRGVGPALELSDALAVLAGAPDAPQALAEKALDFAGAMIEWDAAVEKGTGRVRAATLLASGAALATFERIVDVQGRRPHPSGPGAFRQVVRAEASGTVERVDGFALSGLARAAGAPEDKGAGVEMRALVGTAVAAGEPVLSVISGTADGLDRAGAPGVQELVTIR